MDDTAFSDRLYRLRKGQNISQEELAHIVGVSRQAVQKWEAGTSKPDMDNLTAISDYFGVSLDYLIKGDAGTPQAHHPGEASQERDPWESTDRGFSRVEYGGARPWHWHYEYKSRRTFCGLPLLHVNIGRGKNYQAKGVVALGNSAIGWVALGFASIGLVSVGLVSVGLLTLSCLGVGLVSLGAVSVGGLALGGVAVGYLAFGGLAVGAYAVGGLAVGIHIAAGGGAIGHIAIGDMARGDLLFHIGGGIRDQSAAIHAAILQEYPHIPRWLAALFAAVG